MKTKKQIEDRKDEILSWIDDEKRGSEELYRNAIAMLNWVLDDRKDVSVLEKEDIKTTYICKGCKDYFPCTMTSNAHTKPAFCPFSRVAQAEWEELFHASVRYDKK